MTILNLAQVNPRVWRGGQPVGAVEWMELVALGVKRVIKLNEMTTGADAEYCAAHGLDLDVLTIPDHDAQTALPDASILARIDDAIDRSVGTTFVHCTEGKDRTGIALARYRVKCDGWSKQAAWDEWVAYGSHGYRGLVDNWNAWTLT